MKPATQHGNRTRSDRQKERTRRRLLDAGRTLIAERGVAGLRIQEITEKADVALGSFYNHFAAKEDLVEAVVAESLTDLAGTTVAAIDLDVDPAEMVALAALRIIRLTYDQPEFAQLVVNLSHADTLFAASIEPYARIVIERGIDSGRYVVADLAVTLTATVAAAFALIRELLAGRHQPGAEESFARHVLASLGLDPKDAKATLDAALLRDGNGR